MVGDHVIMISFVQAIDLRQAGLQSLSYKENTESALSFYEDIYVEKIMLHIVSVM
jgi:hypothetical protein